MKFWVKISECERRLYIPTIGILSGYNIEPDPRENWGELTLLEKNPPENYGWVSIEMEQIKEFRDACRLFHDIICGDNFEKELLEWERRVGKETALRSYLLSKVKQPIQV